jgi:hypothetical protein
VLHRPAFAFRPELASPAIDWLALGGLATGLVSVVAGLLRARDERRSPYYRIGCAPGVEQPIDGAPTASFPLVAPRGDEFVLSFGAGMSGELVADGQSIALGDLAARGRAYRSTEIAGAFELPIPANARIFARLGLVSFTVAAVPRPRRQAVPLLGGLEQRTLGFVAGSLGVHLAILVLLQLAPIGDGSTNIEIGVTEPTAIVTSSTNNEVQPPDETTGYDAAGEEATKATPLESGAVGKPDPRDGHFRIKQVAETPALTRAEAIEQAMRVSMLGRLRASDFQSLVQTGDITSGLDGSTFYSGLGEGDGGGHGQFGTGLSGFGAGAGCTFDCGTIPGGRFDLIGKTGRFGGDYSFTGGGPHAGRHVAQVPCTRSADGNCTGLGKPEVIGDFDKTIIRRYIRRCLSQIQYCYDHELLAHPDLAGDVVVQFFILQTGAVKSATGSGVDDAVASCVADVIARIQFPALPPNDPVVQVKYPFSFRRVGA